MGEQFRWKEGARTAAVQQLPERGRDLPKLLERAHKVDVGCREIAIGPGPKVGPSTKEEREEVANHQADGLEDRSTVLQDAVKRRAYRHAGDRPVEAGDHVNNLVDRADREARKVRDAEDIAFDRVDRVAGPRLAVRRVHDIVLREPDGGDGGEDEEDDDADDVGAEERRERRDDVLGRGEENVCD